MKNWIYGLSAIALLCLSNKVLKGQDLLKQSMSVQIEEQSIRQVLDSLSRTGGFYFSYNSEILAEDSIVSIISKDESLEHLLIELLGIDFTYKQEDNYIIIKDYAASGKIFVITGKIIDEKTGEGIADVSVYDKKQLLTTLTDSNGAFELRLNDYSAYNIIGISKVNYLTRDTIIKSVEDREMEIELSFIKTFTLDSVYVYSYKNWISKVLLSPKQKTRDINLSEFFINQNFQTSLWPTIGTQGKMSGQIVNDWSLNVLGGYSGGVRWFEVGGFFNINKKDVGALQIAGVFNAVGGRTEGLQVAGIYNVVGDSLRGTQIAGVYNKVDNTVTGSQVAGILNIVNGTLTGIQIGGIYNQVDGPITGLQIAGIVNKTKSIRGMQLAGITNLNRDTVDGFQLAGIVNKTKHLDGVQLGLINISDTTSGYSIGLLNISRKNGFYRLAMSHNEIMDLNFTFRSGSPKLYNIVSLNAGNLNRHPYWGFTYGIGHLFNYEKKVNYSLELTSQFVVGGFKNDTPVITSLRPSIQVPLSPNIRLFAGPAFSVLFKGSALSKYPEMRIRPVHSMTFYDNIYGWLGFQAGISIF